MRAKTGAKWPWSGAPKIAKNLRSRGPGRFPLESLEGITLVVTPWFELQPPKLFVCGHWLQWLQEANHYMAKSLKTPEVFEGVGKRRSPRVSLWVAAARGKLGHRKRKSHLHPSHGSLEQQELQSSELKTSLHSCQSRLSSQSYMGWLPQTTASQKGLLSLEGAWQGLQRPHTSVHPQAR